MKALAVTLLLIIIFFHQASFAEETKEARGENKYSNLLKPLEYVTHLTQPVKRLLRKNKIDLNFFAGILQGYDNNVNLAPDRKKDGFVETSLNTEIVYNYTDDIRLKVENDTTDILYYNFNDSNLFDMYNRAGFEVDLLDELFTVGADYALDYVWFPTDEDGTYLGNYARLYVQHNVTDDVYHKVGYFFLHKGFIHDRALNARGYDLNEYRKDNRHGASYTAGAHLFDKAIVKAYLEFYRNNANYQYFDYYDYWSFKIQPSFIYMLTEKLYASGNFSYQQRRYDGRLSTEDDEHVYDDTYGFTVSVLYDLTKSFTIAANYSYRENSSNEPLQKYSGSVITAGIYYSF